MWTWLFSSPKWETYLSRTAPVTMTATSLTAFPSVTELKTDVGQNAKTVIFRWVRFLFYCILQLIKNLHQFVLYFKSFGVMWLTIIYAIGCWLVLKEKRKLLCFWKLSHRNITKMARRRQAFFSCKHCQEKCWEC